MPFRKVSEKVRKEESIKIPSGTGDHDVNEINQGKQIIKIKIVTRYVVMVCCLKPISTSYISCVFHIANLLQVAYKFLLKNFFQVLDKV